MNEVLLANVFFIITGSAVLVVSAFVCVVCWHAIKIECKVRALLRQIETGAEMLVEDAKAFRERLAEGNLFGRMFAAVVGALTHITNKRAGVRKKKDDSTHTGQ